MALCEVGEKNNTTENINNKRVRVFTKGTILSIFKKLRKKYEIIILKKTVRKDRAHNDNLCGSA